MSVFDEERKALRARLEPGEQVFSEGRCDVRDSLEGDVYASGRWVLLLTDRRLLWRTYDLDFTALRAWTPVERSHRWGVILDHDPDRRVVSVPKRFLIFAHGSKVVTRSFRRTVFGFSRRDTEVAEALRERLASFAVPARPLISMRVPPKDPRATSMLYRRS